MFVFVFDESLFVFAYATPPFAFALLFDRYTTRCLWEIHLCFSNGGRSNNKVASAPDFTLFRSAFAYAISTIALNAATLFAMTIFPRKASREPMCAYVTDESLYELAHATPPYASAPLYDRYTTRLIEPET